MTITSNTSLNILSYALMNHVKTLDSNLRREIEQLLGTSITSSKDLKALLPKISCIQDKVAGLRWQSSSTLTETDLAALDSFDNQLYEEEKEIRNRIHNYRHLKNTIGESIFEIYRERQLPAKAQIAAATYSLPDGFGDYGNTIWAANDILEIFPHTTLKVFAIIHPNRFDQLEEIEKKKKYPFSVKRWKAKPETIHSQLSQEDTQNLNLSEVFLSISSDCKTTLEEHLPQATKKAACQLFEYGINDPNYMGFSTNLSHNTILTGNGCNPKLKFSNHLVNLRKLPVQERRAEALSTLSKPLSDLIFEGATDLCNYFEKADLSYAYFRAMDSSHTLQTFISVVTAVKQKSAKNLDIVCRFDLSTLPDNLDLDHLRQNGIASLLLVTTAESQQISLQVKGKVLRLINPFPIPNQDALSLTALSSTLIGCTGDCSFSEALSMGPFFYDSFCTKANLIKGLIHNASSNGFTLVADYINHVRTLIAKIEVLPLKDPQCALLIQKVVSTIQNPSFFQQFSGWQDHIYSNNNYKNALELLIKRAWMMKESGTLHSQEKEFIKKETERLFFKNRPLNIKKVQNKFRVILSSH